MIQIMGTSFRDRVCTACCVWCGGPALCGIIKIESENQTGWKGL